MNYRSFVILLALALLCPSATQSGPAPQSWKHESPPAGVREVRYPSGPGLLLAWFATPPKPPGSHSPLVIYLHGGFAFSREDFEVARAFLAAGYAVFTPTFRGENGNPGDFELLAGEVDDVLAAAQWARTQPSVDLARIYVFGHSTGGALASLACLHKDTGIRLGGAASGLYDDSLFNSLAKVVPFQLASSEEKKRRLFLPQLQNLRVPFIFYLESSAFSARTVGQLDSLAAKNRVPLSATLLNGDHYSILPGAIAAFVARIRSQDHGQ